MKTLLYAVLAVSIISCKKKDAAENKKLNIPDSLISSNETNLKVDKIPDNCYLMVNGKDSAAIHLVDNLGTISGNMAVKNSEKDSSSRELTGFTNQDTLKLTYTLKSEGQTSENLIYFLQKGGELIEGFGDYKNPKTLKFDAKNSYKQVNCSQISALLK